MTLRSSTDSILEMGFDSGFGSMSSNSSQGDDSSPPDSPDDKYWSFAAAAASVGYDKRGPLKVSIELPDYHYTDRAYLHKHGLPIIGKFFLFAVKLPATQLATG